MSTAFATIFRAPARPGSEIRGTDRWCMIAAKSMEGALARGRYGCLGGPPVGITVIPAYRVVAKFARQARALSVEDGADELERNLRDYVRNLLSMLHPSIMELGERAAATQLGDPVPDDLNEALGELEAGSPKAIVERALAKCSARLPRPDLNSRVFLFPGDGESRVLVRQMNGVLGFSLGAQAMMVFLWPVDGWQEWLSYTVTHEYTHLVRNLLYPRGLAGGKLVYMKTQEPETLLDALVAEGMADVFATGLNEDVHPPWSSALTPDLERRLWPRVHRRLGVSDTTEIRRILFGDNDRIPLWTGYTYGYRIVTSYLEAKPDAQPASLVALSAKAIFEGSGYDPAS